MLRGLFASAGCLTAVLAPWTLIVSAVLYFADLDLPALPRVPGLPAAPPEQYALVGFSAGFALAWLLQRVRYERLIRQLRDAVAAGMFLETFGEEDR